MVRTVGKMGTPFAGRERRREWLEEAYLLATQAFIPDPLALTVSEFNAYSSLVARGSPQRTLPTDPREYVERAMRGEI